jgi:hypothetical protein
VKSDELSAILYSYNVLLHRSHFVRKLKPKSRLAANIFSEQTFSLFNSASVIVQNIIIKKPLSSGVLLFSYQQMRRERKNLIANNIAMALGQEIISIEDFAISEKNRNLIFINIHLLYFISHLAVFLARILNTIRLYALRDSLVGECSIGAYRKLYGGYNLYCVKFYAFIFRLILRKFKPSVVLTTNWYGIRSLGLLLACKEFKIPFVDIQHGLAAAAGHRAYTKLDELDSRCLPDAFLVWGARDAQRINEEVKLMIAFPVGNLTVPSNRFESKWSVEGKGILVALGISVPIWVDDLIDSFSEQYKIFIREHPSFRLTQAQRDSFSSRNVEVEDSSQSIYTSFQKCAFVFGEWSAALVESASIGLRTIAIGDNAKVYFQNYENIEVYSTFSELDNFKLANVKASDNTGSEGLICLKEALIEISKK